MHHGSLNRFKPFDSFRERRRIICNKKLASQLRNCTDAVSLSSRRQSRDHLNRSLVPPVTISAVNGIDSVYPASTDVQSDIVLDTRLSAGYRRCLGMDKLEMQLHTSDTFNRCSKLMDFATETLKEQTAGAEYLAYNRYAALLISFRHRSVT